MAKTKKASCEETESAEEVKLPKFTCNVNYNNVEYKQGDEWKATEIPESIKQFLE